MGDFVGTITSGVPYVVIYVTPLKNPIYTTTKIPLGSGTTSSIKKLPNKGEFLS